jgi:hypothetical protein
MRDVVLRKVEDASFAMPSLCVEKTCSGADGVLLARRNDTLSSSTSSGGISIGGERLERARMSRSLRSHAASASVSREKFSHARFTLMIAGARVALHVRGDGEKVIVIAVCSARHVNLVRRALVEAGEAMRLRGERVEMTVTAPDAKDRA